MPEGTPQSPIKSMMMDVRPLQQPENSYAYGKNGVIFKGVSTNEAGFEKMAAVVPYHLNGVIETDTKPILFSTNNVYSAGGYFNPVTGLYEPIFDDAGYSYKLGFRVNNWIIGQTQRNYKGEVIIAFTDKVTFPKYLNADKPNVTRLEDWNLFPYYKTPTINTYISQGGRLPQGTYYVSAYYQRVDGTTTPHSQVSLGKTVYGINQVDITDKALTIEITSADITYDFIVVSVISRVKGVTSSVDLSPVPVNATGSTTVIYTGDNITQASSLEEILTPPAVYTKIGTMGQLNDALYIGGVEVLPDLTGLQEYASLIQLKWVSKLINAVGAPQEHINGEEKGFMHEEVYAMFVRYRLAKGGVTKAYTIPGNLPNPGEDTTTSAEAAGGKFAGLVYQVDDCIHSYNAGLLEGDTGVWVNTNEKYPSTDDFNSLPLSGLDNRNKVVRHHKMPSLRFCKQNLYPAEAEYGRTKLDILGIKAINVTIPSKYIGIIDGYEILYAKRTIANTTVYGQGLLLHGAGREEDLPKVTDAIEVYSTGSNWDSFTKTRPQTSYRRENNLYIRPDTMRLHSFDMLLNQPGVKANYISAQLKHSVTGLNSQVYQDGLDSSGNRTAQIYLVDFTTTKDTVTVPVTGNLARGVKDGGQYLPNNINVNKFINLRHEKCFGGQLLGNNWPIATQTFGAKVKDVGGVLLDITGDVVETYLINLKAIKPDLYNSFHAQVLVTAGNAKQLTDSTTFFGGDTYVGDYTFHTYGRHDSIEWIDGPVAYGGKKVIHRFVCESVSNINLRYEDIGNMYSKWYPHTALIGGDLTAYPELWLRTADPNQFGYTKDLNALNDLLSTSIFYPARETLTRFPYRVHRGGKLSRQSKLRSWRSFLPLDYYEMQKNMGFINHIEGMDDKLIIHCENAMFLTQDKAKLDNGLLGVTLGSGDIFQFEPQESASAKLGYAGTQHELACVRTPMGYIFVDSKQGEIYLYKGGLENLSVGLSRFLIEYLKVPGINPFNGNGITVGWDQRFKRILLSVKRRTVPLDRRVKPFEDTSIFWTSLVPGDIVLLDNRFIEYTGLG